MKKIEACVRPERRNDVRNALVEAGHRSMVQYDIWYRGTENEIGQQEDREGARLYDYMSKVKIELIVTDESVQGIVDTICERAYTGHTGDGKIFVFPAEMAIRIQTKETGDVF
jgi:nitrogen regulatory protein P-II 1